MTALPERKTTSIIVILCLITSMGRFVIDNYLPSLPAIRMAFHVPTDSIQLTLTLYILGFGVSQLIYGPLSDRFGRKKVLISGLILFLISNTFCIFTHSLPILLVARLFAGLGMGVCGVLNRAIANDCFSGAEFSRVWSYTTTTLVIVLIVAPLIGSAIQHTLDWRANFAIATLFVGIAISIIVWKLPETNKAHRFASITFKKVAHNYQQILASRSFVLSTLCYTFAFAGLIAYFQASPFLFMNALHLSPLQYGYTSLVIAGSYLAGGLIVTHLARRLGIKLLLILGIAFIIASGLLMMEWNEEGGMTLLSILIPTAVYVVGARIIIPNAMAGAFTGFRHLSGSASGLIGSIQMLGTACISFIMIHFGYQSPLPLAFLFTLLGVASCIAFCFMHFYKNKYLYKHFVRFSVGAIELYRDRYVQQCAHTYLRVIDAWLIRMKCKPVLKKMHYGISKCSVFSLKMYYKYNLNTYINRFLQAIRNFLVEKYGMQYKKMKAFLLKKIQATSIYHYFYSGLRFAFSISHKRTLKNKSH